MTMRPATEATSPRRIKGQEARMNERDSQQRTFKEKANRTPNLLGAQETTASPRVAAY